MIAAAPSLPFDGRAALLAAAEAFAGRTPADARTTALARQCRAVAPFLARFAAGDVVRAFALVSSLPRGEGVAPRCRADVCRRIASVLGIRGTPPAGAPHRAAEVWGAIVAGLEGDVQLDEPRVYLDVLLACYRVELVHLGQ